MKVAHVSKVSIDILYQDIVHTCTLKHPGVTAVTLATSVTINGTDYKKDRMMIVHGSCGDLPEFSKITQLCIIKEDLSLFVKTFFFTVLGANETLVRLGTSGPGSACKMSLFRKSRNWLQWLEDKFRHYNEQLRQRGAPQT